MEMWYHKAADVTSKYNSLSFKNIFIATVHGQNTESVSNEYIKNRSTTPPHGDRL